MDDALRAFRDSEDIVRGREYQADTDSVLELSAGNRITAYDLEFVALAVQLHIPS